MKLNEFLHQDMHTDEYSHSVHNSKYIAIYLYDGILIAENSNKLGGGDRLLSKRALLWFWLCSISQNVPVKYKYIYIAWKL